MTIGHQAIGTTSSTSTRPRRTKTGTAGTSRGSSPRKSSAGNSSVTGRKTAADRGRGRQVRGLSGVS